MGFTYVGVIVHGLRDAKASSATKSPQALIPRRRLLSRASNTTAKPTARMAIMKTNCIRAFRSITGTLILTTSSATSNFCLYIKISESGLPRRI